MKILPFILSLFLLTSFSSISQKSELDHFFNQTDIFMSMYVQNGKVDYQGLKENNSSLKDLVDKIKTLKVKNVSEENYKKSFLINAYNILVINQIVENYPTASPMAIIGFFKGNKFQVADFGKVSLNTLENDLVRKVYKDPRAHFVMVCAGKGCPPIIEEAYIPSKLEAQLNRQTKKALNDPQFIQVNEKSVKLSEIFKWYSDDFVSKGKNEIDYINEFREVKINSKSKIGYYDYDWSLNSSQNNSVASFDSKEKEFSLQTYNAGSLLAKGQYDLTLFNSLYTQQKSEWKGTLYSGSRETFASSLIQFTYGISKNSRINLGFDIKLGSSGKAINDSSFSAINRAFAFKNNDSTRVGVSSLGPRVRIQPFKNVSNFTIQSSILISPSQSPEGNESLFFLEWDRIQWWNQFFYTKDLNKSQLFFEVDLWYRFGYKKNNATALDVPVTVIYSYFPNNKTTIYGLISHNTRNQYNPNDYNDDITTAANYTSAGLGFKYQVTSSLNLELLYSNFLRGTNFGLGNTFSIGLRYVH